MTKLTKITISLFIFIVLFSRFCFAEINQNNGLTISPISQELNISPGEKYQGSLKITNISNNDSMVRSEIADFTAANDSGQPEIVLSNENSNYSLKNYISLSENEFTLAPKESKKINYTITLPKNIEPGGHYGAILFKPTEVSEGNSQIEIGSEVGTIILVNSGGKSLVLGTIEEFNLLNNNKILFNSNSVQFVTKIKNSGNVHFKPKGFISIKNFLNNEVGKIEFNVDNGNILPDQTRKFTNDWSLGGNFGLFKADINLVYGNSQSISSTTTFYVVPIKKTIYFFILLVILVWIIKNIRKKR